MRCRHPSFPPKNVTPTPYLIQGGNPAAPSPAGCRITSGLTRTEHLAPPERETPWRPALTETLRAGPISGHPLGNLAHHGPI